jgi:hypothetical protein
MANFTETLKNIQETLKNRKRRKAIRKKFRRLKKRIFNKRTLTKIFMMFMALALIASYVLPYIVR